MPAPDAYMMLTMPCQVPRSRNGTMSLIITDTTVVIPPPPTRHISTINLVVGNHGSYCQQKPSYQSVTNSWPVALRIRLTRAAISSFIFLASPQKRQPVPKMAYPNKSAGFLPNISLSLPYSGWKDVRVRKYL